MINSLFKDSHIAHPRRFESYPLERSAHKRGVKTLAPAKNGNNSEIIMNKPAEISFGGFFNSEKMLKSNTLKKVLEFAKEAREKHNMSAEDAAMEAAKLRFRAVMMTSIAFILGVLPLVFAMGAGAGSRRSVGMTVFGGMIAVAFIGTLLVPGFYVLIENIKERAEERAALGNKKLKKEEFKEIGYEE